MADIYSQQGRGVIYRMATVSGGDATTGLFRARGEHYRAVYGVAEKVRELIAAGKLTIPVLSISGEASFGAAQLTYVVAFARNITCHMLIPGSGHFVPEEQPQELLTELKKFLEFDLGRIPKTEHSPRHFNVNLQGERPDLPPDPMSGLT